jgi:hypothetical protein
MGGNSSVGIVMGYGMDNWDSTTGRALEIREIPFLLLSSYQTISPGVKRQRLQSDH